MSLDFQLARGAFALAVFALFAATAWLAPPATSAHGVSRAVLVAEADGAVAACPLPAPVLRLASAPGDLPARLLSGGCRA